MQSAASTHASYAFTFILSACLHDVTETSVPLPLLFRLNHNSRHCLQKINGDSRVPQAVSALEWRVQNLQRPAATPGIRCQEE